MDHDEIPVSNSQGRKLKLADKSLYSTAHLELDRDPQTFGSEKDTVLCGGPLPPAIDGYAQHPQKLDKIAIPRGSNLDLFSSGNSSKFEMTLSISLPQRFELRCRFAL